jgi:hypothetical protein
VACFGVNLTFTFTFIYIYIYIYICVCVCVCVCSYMGQSPVQIIKCNYNLKNGIMVKKFHEYEGLFFRTSPDANIISLAVNQTTFNTDRHTKAVSTFCDASNNHATRQMDYRISNSDKLNNLQETVKSIVQETWFLN